MSTSSEVQHSLSLPVGTTLKWKFVFKDGNRDIVDLTDYHAEIDIREKLGDTVALIALKDTEATVAGSTLTINDVAGTVSLTIVPDETEPWLIISKDKSLFWDLRMIAPDGTVRIYYRASPFVLQPSSTWLKP